MVHNFFSLMTFNYQVHVCMYDSWCEDTENTLLSLFNIKFIILLLLLCHFPSVSTKECPLRICSFPPVFVCLTYRQVNHTPALWITCRYICTANIVLHTWHSIIKASAVLYRFVQSIQMKKKSNLSSSSSYVTSCTSGTKKDDYIHNFVQLGLFHDWDIYTFHSRYKAPNL